MRRILAVLLTLAIAGSSVPAAAHEGGIDAKGIVVDVAAERITVDAQGNKQSFALTPKTKIVRAGKPATAADIAPGDRAVVHGRERGGKVEATLIRAAPAKK